MRKYFLLSAAALLTATNVNAGNYADVDVEVNVAYASTFSCAQALDFGTIVIDRDVAADLGPWAISLNPDGSSYGISDGIVNMIGAKPAECSIDLTNATMTVQYEPTHFDDASQGFTITDPQFSGKKFGATLNFTELPQEGEYTGAVRLTIVN